MSKPRQSGAGQPGARSMRRTRKDAAVRAQARPSVQPAAPRARIVLIPAAIAGIALLVTLIVFQVRRSSALPPASTSAAVLSPVASEQQALRAGVVRRPRDAGAQRALARYLLGAGHPLEAVWHFVAAQELDPRDTAARISAGRALTQAGLPDLAHKDLTGLDPAHGGGLEFRAALAETLMATAQPRAAAEALAGAGLELARSAPAQVMLGDAWAAAGDSGQAEAAYRRAAALDPSDAAAWDRRGRLALASRDWAAARDAFMAALRRDRRAAGSLYRLGLAFWGAGKRPQAEAIWKKAAASSPGYAPVQLALGKALHGRHEESAAAVHLGAALRADPSSGEAQRALAEVMSARGDRASALYQRGFADLEGDQPHRALAEFRRLIEIAPERVDGSMMASFACIQMQRPDLAAAEARRGLERHPGDARLLGRLANLCVVGRDPTEARKLCKAWQRRDPSAAEPLRVQARIAREAQRLDEARRFAEQALAKDPDNALACHELSKILAATPGRGNARRALDLAGRATERNPREADYWYELGMLLHAAGRPEEAAGALLRSLEAQLNDTEPCSLLVQIAAQEKRPQTARFFAGILTRLEERRRSGTIFWRAAHAHPEDAPAHARLARLLLANGDLHGGRNQLRQVVSLRPQDADAQRELALVERLLDLRSD